MKRKPPTARHDTEGRKEKPEMESESQIFTFCDLKQQRISQSVCQANIKKGTCKKDLWKCGKAKTPRTKTPDNRYLDPFSKEIMKQKIKEEKATNPTPKRLPVITLNKKQYFKDERLHQLRNVENPHDFINLEGQLDLFPERKE